MLRRLHELCSICAFLGLCCFAAWCLQNNEPLATGEDAEAQFLYQGLPIHPFCLDFPLEGASRSKPIKLAACTETAITPHRDDKGWLTAEYQSQPMPAGYVLYKVLAKKKSRFLVATTVSGGGSGIFDSLMWVELSKDRIALVKEEPGGDRCAGGIVDEYAIDGASVRFSRSVTPADIVQLSGIKMDALADELEWSPASCFGKAYYEYDLATEISKLVSVHLHTPDGNGRAEGQWAQNANSHRYQPCFNRLFNECIDKGKSDLNLTELKEFGRKFSGLCTDVKSRRPSIGDPEADARTK